MSTRGKWGRWVQSLPAYAPEWTCARRDWLVRDHACAIVALGAGALLVSAAWALARYADN